MAHYLQYWARPRADIAFNSVSGPVLALENGWFKNLSRSDTLWILSRVGDALVLVLRAEIATEPKQLRSHPAYAIRNSSVFQNRRVTFRAGTATGPYAVPITMEDLRRLRFHGRSKRVQGPLTGILEGPLGSLRKLTDSTVPILEEIWARRWGHDWADLDSHREPTVSMDISPPKPTRRIETTVARIVRNTRQVLRLKSLHRDRCQICGTSVELSGGGTYSEGHHLQPLGASHRGPDTTANILILCPNHHAQLDFAGLRIAEARLRTHPDHVVDKKYIRYHNRMVRARQSDRGT